MRRYSLVVFLATATVLTLTVVVPVAMRAPEAGSSSHAPTVGLVDPSQGQWHLRDEAGNVKSFFFGNPGDVPVMGDWDCSGSDTPGLFRTSDAFAYLSNANRSQVADIRFFFGNPSDVPLAGDWDGDGCDTLSIYRPAEQRFYIVNELGANEGGLGPADFSFTFGNPGDKPVVGDWDADGIDEVGLHRESTGFFYWRNTLSTGTASGEIFFGDPGDRFVAGDWGTVDGADTPAVFRPSNTTFFFRHTLTQGNADASFPFGSTSWLPIAGRFGFDSQPPSTSSSTSSTSSSTSSTSSSTSSTSSSTTMPAPPWPPCNFAPFTVKGMGDSVPALSVPGDEPAVLDISHSGASNFAVWTLDAGFDTIDLLVNEIGAYQGIRPTNHWDADEKVRYLEITADGAWQVDVRTFCSARSMTGDSMAGAGDEVILVSQSGPATFTHNGSSNFFVWSYQSSNRRDLEVNEIGPFNGQELIDAGTVFLEMGADGDWTVNFP